MKVNVNYSTVHKAITALEEGRELCKLESDAVLEVLKATLGDYIPTIDELELQKWNVERLGNLDYESQKEAFTRILAQCTEFENQYC